MILFIALLRAQDAFDISAVLWTLAVGALLVALAVAFAYLLVHRYRDALGQRLDALDAFLARRMPRPWRFIRRRFSRQQWHGLELTLALGGVLATMYGFVYITQNWIDQGVLYRFDRAVNQAIQELLPEGTVRLLAFWTDLGGVQVAVAVSVVLVVWFLLRRQYWRLLALGMVMGVGTAVMWSFKLFFERERPVGLLGTPTDPSFPSGHSSTAMMLYGFLIFLLWQSTHRAWVRWASTLLLVSVIFFVGLSRVLLSVHWVSDVLGGLVLGLGWLSFSLIFIRAAHALSVARRTTLPVETPTAS